MLRFRTAVCASPTHLGSDPSSVSGRLVEVVANDLMRRGGGAGEVTRHLRLVHVASLVEAEPAHVVVAGLFLQVGVIYAPGVHSRGGPRLEPIRLKPELLNVVYQVHIIHPPPRVCNQI